MSNTNPFDNWDKFSLKDLDNAKLRIKAIEKSLVTHKKKSQENKNDNRKEIFKRPKKRI